MYGMAGAERDYLVNYQCDDYFALDYSSYNLFCNCICYDWQCGDDIDGIEVSPASV